jgi:glycosyltransferase involved in cell wall biosynthesis
MKRPDILEVGDGRVGGSPLSQSEAIVAVPARNEAERISRCLASFAVQRDRLGAPIPAGDFGVLLLVNNSSDETAEIARRMAPGLPYPLEILEVVLTPPTAGRARRQSMEEAAVRLRASPRGGVLLTTDADSVVSPVWYAGNIHHLQSGAHCVAGYIDAEAPEIVSLGSAFLTRGRLEDRYLRLVAEIYALCDPRRHDPWPNHRVSSGASLAVTLAAYDAVGGMPDKALGEDTAFTALLDEGGFRVRHALDVSVLTSCRLDGRARGGAADTMRHRRDVPDAPCDDELELALATLRRAVMRGFLRRAFFEGKLGQAGSRLLGANQCPCEPFLTFSAAWRKIEALHPKLKRGFPLRPSMLAREIAIAEFILRHLRLKAESKGVQADRCPRAVPLEPAYA